MSEPKMLTAEELAELRARFERHTALSNPDTERLFAHITALRAETARVLEPFAAAAKNWRDTPDHTITNVAGYVNMFFEPLRAGDLRAASDLYQKVKQP